MTWTEWEVVNDEDERAMSWNYTSRQEAIDDAIHLASSLPNNTYRVVEKKCEYVYSTYPKEIDLSV